MYEFWYYYVIPIYGENTNLCYMDTDSFIFHIKTNVIYKGIAGDVEARFDATTFESGRPLPKGKIKKYLD